MPKARLKLTMEWKLRCKLMSNHSKLPSLRRKINLCLKDSKLRTRSSHFWDRSRRAKTRRRLSAESYWTNSKTRLSRSVMSTHRLCSEMPKHSQSCRHKKSVNTRLILMLSRCLRERTRIKSYSRKSNTEKKWRLNKLKSMSKKKTTKS